jgi:hypothetical protein
MFYPESGYPDDGWYWALSHDLCTGELLFDHDPEIPPTTPAFTNASLFSPSDFTALPTSLSPASFSFSPPNVSYSSYNFGTPSATISGCPAALPMRIAPGNLRGAESFFGVISSTKDVNALANASLCGCLPLLRNPLNAAQKSLIRSGSVFVYHQRDALIKPWKDGYRLLNKSIINKFTLAHVSLHGVEFERRTYKIKGTSGNYLCIVNYLSFQQEPKLQRPFNYFEKIGIQFANIHITELHGRDGLLPPPSILAYKRPSYMVQSTGRPKASLLPSNIKGHESYYGLLDTLEDAKRLIDEAIEGRIKYLSRPIQRSECSQVRPGSVFVRSVPGERTEPWIDGKIWRTISELQHKKHITFHEIGVAKNTFLVKQVFSLTVDTSNQRFIVYSYRLNTGLH